MSREPMLVRAPAANKSESPGRIGVITRPVSAKTTKESKPYAQAPLAATSALSWVSRWNTHWNAFVSALPASALALLPPGARLLPRRRGARVPARSAIPATEILTVPTSAFPYLTPCSGEPSLFEHAPAYAFGTDPSLGTVHISAACSCTQSYQGRLFVPLFITPLDCHPESYHARRSWNASL